MALKHPHRLRNALLVLLNAISEDKDALRTLAKRDPKAIEQAVEVLKGEDLTQHFQELLTFLEIQVRRCREITEKISRAEIGRYVGDNARYTGSRSGSYTVEYEGKSFMSDCTHDLAEKVWEYAMRQRTLKLHSGPDAQIER